MHGIRSAIVKNIWRAKKYVGLAQLQFMVITSRIDCEVSAAQKPQLIILGGRRFALRGHCSVCKTVKFAASREVTNLNYQEQRLKYLFNQHFAKVHLHKVERRASQRKIKNYAMNNGGESEFSFLALTFPLFVLHLKLLFIG